jgi:hypothetical protein
MSHHASGPNFGFPRGDARLDMTDLYAFIKPGAPAKTIVVLTVCLSVLFASKWVHNGSLGGDATKHVTYQWPG